MDKAPSQSVQAGNTETKPQKTKRTTNIKLAFFYFSSWSGHSNQDGFYTSLAEARDSQVEIDFGRLCSMFCEALILSVSPNGLTLFLFLQFLYTFFPLPGKSSCTLGLGFPNCRPQIYVSEVNYGAEELKGLKTCWKSRLLIHILIILAAMQMHCTY
jgi:hypothetical protein